jgi:hypothetical protein
MPITPPTLQDLARRRKRGPFPFPKFTPVTYFDPGPQDPVVGLLREINGNPFLPLTVITAENGDILEPEGQSI